jgi:hypothetical protein
VCGPAEEQGGSRLAAPLPAPSAAAQRPDISLAGGVALAPVPWNPSMPLET